MIPKTFHRVWIQQDENDVIPEQYETFWKQLRELHPRGWSFETWTEPPPLRNQRLYDRLSELGGSAAHGYRSDIVRYEVIARHGGIYVDTDVEPLRPFDELLSHTAFIAWCSQKELDPAVFGGERGAPAMRALVDELPKPERWEKRWSPPGVTGPMHATRVLKARSDVRRLPPILFYPVHWTEMKHWDRTGPYPLESIARHHWKAGWKQLQPTRR